MSESISNFIDILCCPLCNCGLSIESSSLVCEGKGSHTFGFQENVIDFTGGLKTEYDQHWSEFQSSPKKDLRCKHFLDWCSQEVELKQQNLILDLGCGDGNHTAYFTDKNYIAVDISNSIYSLASRYAEHDNMLFLKADAFDLPLKEKSVDFIFSFAGVNYFPSYGSPSIQSLLAKLDLILTEKSFAAFWGAGANSRFSLLAFQSFRKLYRNSPRLFQNMLLYLGCASTLFIRNSANIHPLNSSLKHVKEMVATNLTPDFINYFFDEKWADLKPNDWELVKEYEIHCGQLFQKKSLLT